VLVLAVALVVVLAMNRNADSAGLDPDRLAELEAAELARNVEQVGELTELARSARDALLPVVEGMNEALPMDGSPGAMEAESVASWKATVDAVAEGLAEPPSGATGHNVARGGLRTAVELFSSAVAASELALGADNDRRAELEALAADLRLQGLRAWSVAATQLDAINIDAGYGHTHIYLPADPESGAMVPDSFPEGSESHDHHHGDGE
jgi:hypothetical protein